MLIRDAFTLIEKDEVRLKGFGSYSLLTCLHFRLHFAVVAGKNAAAKRSCGQKNFEVILILKKYGTIFIYLSFCLALSNVLTKAASLVEAQYEAYSTPALESPGRVGAFLLAHRQLALV